MPNVELQHMVAGARGKSTYRGPAPPASSALPVDLNRLMPMDEFSRG